MEKGRYTGHRVDFTEFAVSRFIPHLFVNSLRVSYGCGATALALLTGRHPAAISLVNRNAHYSDKFMLRFLHTYGFSTVKLTLCNVSTARNKVGNGHVLLLTQLLKQNEGTWGVLFEEMYYHNFQILQLSSLSFVNRPILSAYVINHRKWQSIENEA